MAESLVLGGLFELLGGEPPPVSTLPECPGATFRLGAAYSLGDVTYTAQLVASLFGGGERPAGWQPQSREMTLPVVISVPSTGTPATDRQLLDAARERLLEAVTADSFRLIWSPDGSAGARNLVWECWHAAAAVNTWSLLLEENLISEVTVRFTAQPFGRSDTLETITFDAPLAGQDPPPAPVTLDDYSVVGSAVQPTWWSQSGVSASGSWSARWSHDITDKDSPLYYSRAVYASQGPFTFESSLGNWITTGNCAATRSNEVAGHGGSWELKLACNVAGPAEISAGSCQAANITTQGMRVAPGDVVNADAYFRTVATVRAASVGVEWYQENGTQISMSWGTDANDAADWTCHRTASLTAPALAAWCRMRVRLTSAVNGEIHYVDDAFMSRGAAADITGRPKLALWVGLGCDAGRYRHWHAGPVQFQVTLTDSSARTITCAGHHHCQASDDQDWPLWNLVSLSIPQGKTFTYTAVTAYSVTAWSETRIPSGTLVRELDTTGYLCMLTATTPAAPKRPSPDRGGTYVLHDIVGSAPTAISAHFQLEYPEQSPLTLTGTTKTVNLPGTPGSVASYTAPAEYPNFLSADNAGFEDGLGTWTQTGSVTTIARSTSLYHSGVASLELTSTGAGTVSAAHEDAASYGTGTMLPVIPGQRLILKGYVRGTNARTAYLRGQFYTSGGADATSVTGPSITVPTGAWSSQMSGRITVPATAAWCRLWVDVPSVAAANEKYYFDDLHLMIAVAAKVICLGSGGGGGGTHDTDCAAGGGGGGEIAWEDWLDLTPGGAHSYRIGKGGLAGDNGANGGDGQSSYFTGASVTVTANGGANGHGASSYHTNGSAGAGGTGSPNTHKYDGGAGAAGDYYNEHGGGGGQGAGDGGAGAAASGYDGGNTNNAGSLGIRGGAGADGYYVPTSHGGDVAGDGAVPGGGGGGSKSQDNGHHGSDGGNGMIRLIITTYSTSGGGGSFKTLIVHKPPAETALLAKQVIAVGSGAVAPDGREYQIDQVDGQNARYRGTFIPVLVAWSFNGATARTVTLTFKQYEATGGLAASKSVQRSVTPSGITNGIIMMPAVSLPVRDLPPDNTSALFTVAVTSGDTADRMLDLVLLDAQGASFVVSISDADAAYSDYYIDAPEPGAGISRVLASVAGRARAVSVLGDTLVTGAAGSLRVEPGTNTFVVYSRGGRPSLEADYWPAWHFSRAL